MNPKNLAVIAALSIAFSSARGEGVVLVRNNDIQTLDPVTPPFASLFDSTTGALFGAHFAQDYTYVAYSEDLLQPEDGPLVLYVLDAPNHTLLMSKGDGLLWVHAAPNSFLRTPLSWTPSWGD